MASVSGAAYSENDESVTPTLTVLEVSTITLDKSHYRTCSVPRLSDITLSIRCQNRPNQGLFRVRYS